MNKTFEIRAGVLAGFILLATLGGFIIAPDAQIKEVVKEVPKVQTVQSCPQEQNWKALKDLDDTGFSIAAQSFNIVSDMFKAQATLDVDAFNAKMLELNAKTESMTEVAKQRQELLTKLGY